MYSRYAEANRWTVELMSSNATEFGGFKEAFMIEGGGARRLKYESGVHRVQRFHHGVRRRIHTAATVAVLRKRKK